MSYLGLGGINSRAVSWKFRVEVSGIVQTDLLAEFLEVEGLGVERETVTLNVGGMNETVVTLPGRIKRGNITLKRGLIDLALLEWLMKHVDTTVKPEPVDITISLATESNVVAQTWEIKDAWPVKWSGPSLKADSAEIAIESIELAHAGSGDGGSGGGGSGDSSASAEDKDEKELDDIDCHIIAQKVMEMMRLDVSREKERIGRGSQRGWR